MVGSVGHQLYTENGWKMDEGWKERVREGESRTRFGTCSTDRAHRC